MSIKVTDIENTLYSGVEPYETFRGVVWGGMSSWGQAIDLP